MSDDNDTPAAAPAAVPEVSKGWNGQDLRTLIITIVGTLAANLGTLILIGLAIGYVRFIRHNYRGRLPVWYVPATLGICVITVLAIVGGNHLRRRSDGNELFAVGWFFILLGSVGLLEIVLFWTGLAAGVK